MPFVRGVEIDFLALGEDGGAVGDAIVWVALLLHHFDVAPMGIPAVAVELEVVKLSCFEPCESVAEIVGDNPCPCAVRGLFAVNKVPCGVLDRVPAYLDSV